jgi:chromosome segregation ATPase
MAEDTEQYSFKDLVQKMEETNKNLNTLCTKIEVLTAQKQYIEGQVENNKQDIVRLENKMDEELAKRPTISTIVISSTMVATIATALFHVSSLLGIVD